MWSYIQPLKCILEYEGNKIFKFVKTAQVYLIYFIYKNPFLSVPFVIPNLYYHEQRIETETLGKHVSSPNLG